MKKTLMTCFFCASVAITFAQSNNPLQSSTRTLTPIEEVEPNNQTTKVITQSTYNGFSVDKKAMVDAHPEIYTVVEDEASIAADQKQAKYNADPEGYQESVMNGAKIELSRKDYKALPKHKKKEIDAHPEKYIITK